MPYTHHDTPVIPSRSTSATFCKARSRSGPWSDFCTESQRRKRSIQDVDLTARDGTKLHAWYLHPMGWGKATRRQRPTILFFQENAGNMTFRLPFLKLLARYLDCSIFAPRYACRSAWWPTSAWQSELPELQMLLTAMHRLASSSV